MGEMAVGIDGSSGCQTTSLLSIPPGCLILGEPIAQQPKPSRAPGFTETGPQPRNPNSETKKTRRDTNDRNKERFPILYDYDGPQVWGLRACGEGCRSLTVVTTMRGRDPSQNAKVGTLIKKAQRSGAESAGK